MIIENVRKDNVMGLIRDYIDPTEMKKKIKKILNEDSLKVFSDFLMIENIDLGEYTEKQIHEIKFMLIFLVYAEAITIYEAKEIIEELKINDNSDALFDILFLLMLIEMKMYEIVQPTFTLLGGNVSEYFTLYNSDSIFNHLSKIFVNEPSKISYADIDGDLKADWDRIKAINVNYDSSFFGVLQMYDGEIEAYPFLINNEYSDFMKVYPFFSALLSNKGKNIRTDMTKENIKIKYYDPDTSSIITENLGNVFNLDFENGLDVTRKGKYELWNRSVFSDNSELKSIIDNIYAYFLAIKERMISYSMN